MKFQTRYLLYIALPIFLINLAFTIFNSIAEYTALEDLSKGEFISKTENLSAKIANHNSDGVAISKTSAISATQLFGNRNKSTRFLKELLYQFPQYIPLWH